MPRELLQVDSGGDESHLSNLLRDNGDYGSFESAPKDLSINFPSLTKGSLHRERLLELSANLLKR